MMDILEKISSGRAKLALIGLGYVGLPLAVEFGKRFDTFGFDVKKERIDELRAGRDSTLEISGEELKAAKFLRVGDDPEGLRGCDVYIVTVPTPVDKYNRPDLTPLYRASETVGKVMPKGALVIYESTVYPGCTEEDCVPMLEKGQGLVFNRDFFCGYSPERINPGDKSHTLRQIRKITSGSTPEAAEAVAALYQSILDQPVYRAASIKVAEAAKVIENAQRDLNIAFVNELSKIFRLIGIDTGEVLEAAGTKWNFLPFRPGLVGGHCIGVDPYYLTHKAQSLGYHPEVILAGRRINDGMSRHVATEIIKLMIHKKIGISGARVLQLGITFKENCPDIRNSQSAALAAALADFGCAVDVCDPWASPEEVARNYGFASVKELDKLDLSQYDAAVLAVSHREFGGLSPAVFTRRPFVLYDVKGLLPKEAVDGRL